MRHRRARQPRASTCAATCRRRWRRPRRWTGCQPSRSCAWPSACPCATSPGLTGLLQQLYDPASTNYHRWLTLEQFTERFGPAQADYERVAEFARAHGLTVTVRHPNRLVLDVEGPVPAIEKAFHIALRVYPHPTEARTFYAPDSEPLLDLAVSVSLSSSATNCLLGNVGPSWSVHGGTFTLGYAFTPTTDLRVTHVRTYFGTKVSIWTDAGVLLAAQNVPSVPGTWMETPLATPLTLRAGTRYRVGVFSSDSTCYRGDGGASTFTHGTLNQSYEVNADGFPSYADSANWWLVDLRYTTGPAVPLAMTPTTSGSFVGGSWTGNIAVLQAATNVMLTATDDAGRAGSSTPFQVVAAPGAAPWFVPGTLRRLSNGQFEFQLAGTPWSTYEIEASTDLQNWQLLQSIMLLDSTTNVLDESTNGVKRFYRARLVK